MNVHIVVREGPEWSDIVKAFECPKAAAASAKHRNDSKNMADVDERLSIYKVVPVGVVAKKEGRKQVEASHDNQ